ncbi:MAG TPA: AMP-binding protein [Candidatus Obscuribacter sp.]|nr:AMP-binding protein [Candidatus Obscuribacter sp.]HMY02268.1 AMP-binding protein [Candidatus Obscuribacter sp.]HMY52343.1 AMP-binding protein [Candidatus Obscuribacter sp.]
MKNGSVNVPGSEPGAQLDLPGKGNLSSCPATFPQPLSYDYGVCAEKLLGYTLSGHLDLITAASPDTQAVVSVLEGEKLTYLEFQAYTRKLACALLARGVERGDRIGIWSTNNWRWLAALYAVSRVGGILVNINPAYRVPELEYVLNQSGVKLLFTIPRNRSSNYLEMLQELSPRLFPHGGKAVAASTVPSLQDIVVMPGQDLDGTRQDFTPAAELFSMESFLELAQSITPEELSLREAEVQFDDPVNIQYTSGTTGFPKGVTLSHHNLLNNGLFAARAMALDTKTRFCIPMPFYHCGGMVSSALATFTVGGTVIVPAPYFEELTVMKAVSGEKATHISGVPTMFIGQLEHPNYKDYDYTSLRGGFMAGAPCPVQLMRRVASEMHVPEVVILYGLTEVSPLMTATTIHDSMETRATTVGRAIAGVEVKIIDPESGKVVPRGSQGEICCRGHGIMLGYYKNEEATRECIDGGGWLHSGDLGVMNGEGYLHITGRKKDMIIRGGENIYPREIEEVLHHHPQISQAQVFGIPDEKLGEEVCLWLMLKAGEKLDEAALVAWMKERLAHFKVPRHVRVVSEFPMTVTGKIRKFAMRDAMVEELGLSRAAAIETA